MAYGQEQAAAIQRGSVLNGGGYSAGQIAPAPSPVMIAQKQLDAATNDLHSLIGDLKTRLSSVLSPEDEKNGLNEPPSPPTVAGQISQSARVVEGACARLRDILARLEV